MKTILTLPGDGIGPEVTSVAIDVLSAVMGDQLRILTSDIGGVAIDRWGEPLPRDTRDLAVNADAVLLGAVGGPRWDGLPGDRRPEAGLLGLRKLLGTYACLRPVRLPPGLEDMSPLRPEAASGIDFVLVRELVGGIYFGRRQRNPIPDGWQAEDVMTYTSGEIRRVAICAFDLAASRSGRVVSVDKANVLECSRLWRETVTELAAQRPEIEVRHMLVDTCALELAARPRQFDVILTENMFGDILSDLGGALVGSMGLLPSASLDPSTGRSLYEPVHGSAPDIANKDRANPTAAILCAAMMLDLSFGLSHEARRVERAVDEVLSEGIRTPDIAGSGPSVGTVEFGRMVMNKLAAAG